MKALVGAFNQEKALVGAFSVIVKTGCGTDGSLHSTSIQPPVTNHSSPAPPVAQLQADVPLAARHAGVVEIHRAGVRVADAARKGGTLAKKKHLLNTTENPRL